MTRAKLVERLKISVGRTELELIGGGVWHPDTGTLYVADAHLGKESSFRAASIAVPAGSTDETLSRLMTLIETLRPDELVFLGDLFHDRASLSAEIRQSLLRFFDDVGSTTLTLVRGNHDASVGSLPDGWPIRDVGGSSIRDRIALSHFPADPPDGCDVLLCGHLHPATRLRHGDDRLGKLPCYWVAGGTLVLPAIGDFTGTATITPRDDDRVFLWVENKIIPHRWDVARDDGRRGGRMRPPTTGSAKSPRRLVR